MHLPILLQRIMKLLNEQTIKAFIDSRQKVSENTKLAYFYDLRGFLNFLAGQELTQAQLNRYQITLQSLASSTQHRKVTNLNIFFKYLYQNGKTEQFYELQPVSERSQKKQLTTHQLQRQEQQILALRHLYHDIRQPGDLIALLILEFGLKPSEIQTLKWADFNWDYKILSVTTKQLKRILPIRDRFARVARRIQNADDLFIKSRQFIHYELKKTTPLTAVILRDQYILQRIAEDISIYDLAQNLGLKSIHSLEKYYR